MFLKRFLKRKTAKKSDSKTVLQAPNYDHTIPLELEELSDDFRKISLGSTLDQVVYWDTETDTHMKTLGHTGGGKSVVERNILFHCLKHHENWDIFGFDFTRIELGYYKKYSNVQISVNIYEALAVLKNIHYEMTNRYLAIENESANNNSELKEPFKNTLLLFDAVFYMLDLTGVKTEEGKEHDRIVAEMCGLLLDIAESGKAVNIHICAAGHRDTDFTSFPEIFRHFSGKLATGRLTEKESLSMFGNNSAADIRYTQRGRSYIQSLNGLDETFQVYYTSHEWLEKNLPDLPQKNKSIL